MASSFVGSRAAGPLYYAPHFTLLAVLVAALAAADWRPSDAAASFGFYGALHASAMAATLRQPWPLWRRLMFITAAAALSAIAATTGIGARFLALPGMERAALFLALSSGLGAASYALLIRYYWAHDLPLRAVAAIAVGCIAATLVCFSMEVHYSTLGGLWLAAGWWFAFSAGLWCACRGRAAAASQSIS